MHLAAPQQSRQLISTSISRRPVRVRAQQRATQDSVTTPQQLWAHLAAEQEALQLPDVQTCRLLLSAAAATCTQLQHNQLRPLIQAMPPLFPSFELRDFRQLLQLCAQTRYVPDPELLSQMYYADSGGFERLYAQEAPASLVPLLSDLSAVLSSIMQLMQDTALHTSALLQQQQQQQQEGTHDDAGGLEAEMSALQDAVQQSRANLAAIYQDPLLPGELSAVGGYWLLRRFLPAVQTQPELVLQGLHALPGLGYQALDTEDADALLSQLTPQLQQGAWSPAQLAAAVASSLPCLRDVAPADGQALALLFAAAGAAAAGMGPRDAARTLMVLAQLPGYAPDAQVAQALLSAALRPPLSSHLNAQQLYQLLQAAVELGAAPTGSELQLVQQFLSSSNNASGA